MYWLEMSSSFNMLFRFQKKKKKLSRKQTFKYNGMYFMYSSSYRKAADYSTYHSMSYKYNYNIIFSTILTFLLKKVLEYM